MYLKYAISIFSLITIVAANERLCRKYKDLFILPEDYNNRLAPRGNLTVTNEIHLISIVQVK